MVTWQYLDFLVKPFSILKDKLEKIKKITYPTYIFLTCYPNLTILFLMPYFHALF